MSEKNNSIMHKINEIKSRKKLNDEEKHMKEMLDKSRRCNNKSKLKITITNDIDSHKCVCWITNTGLNEYALMNGDECIITNDSFENVLYEFQGLFFEYWELCGTCDNECELSNIFFSVDMYEDCEIDNCEVYKRNIIYNNVNLVFGTLDVYEKLNIGDIFSEDENNNEEDKINNNFIGIIYECLIILQCTRLKNKFNCEDCGVFNKEVSIKLTGFENYDKLQINNITCD